MQLRKKVVKKRGRNDDPHTEIKIYYNEINALENAHKNLGHEFLKLKSEAILIKSLDDIGRFHEDGNKLKEKSTALAKKFGSMLNKIRSKIESITFEAEQGVFKKIKHAIYILYLKQTWLSANICCVCKEIYIDIINSLNNDIISEIEPEDKKELITNCEKHKKTDEQFEILLYKLIIERLDNASVYIFSFGWQEHDLEFQSIIFSAIERVLDTCTITFEKLQFLDQIGCENGFVWKMDAIFKLRYLYLRVCHQPIKKNYDKFINSYLIQKIYENIEQVKKDKKYDIYWASIELEFHIFKVRNRLLSEDRSFWKCKNKGEIVPSIYQNSFEEIVKKISHEEMHHFVKFWVACRNEQIKKSLAFCQNFLKNKDFFNQFNSNPELIKRIYLLMKDLKLIFNQHIELFKTYKKRIIDADTENLKQTDIDLYDYLIHAINVTKFVVVEIDVYMKKLTDLKIKINQISHDAMTQDFINEDFKKEQKDLQNRYELQCQRVKELGDELIAENDKYLATLLNIGGPRSVKWIEISEDEDNDNESIEIMIKPMLNQDEIEGPVLSELNTIDLDLSKICQTIERSIKYINSQINFSETKEFFASERYQVVHQLLQEVIVNYHQLGFYRNKMNVLFLKLDEKDQNKIRKGVNFNNEKCKKIEDEIVSLIDKVQKMENNRLKFKRKHFIKIGTEYARSIGHDPDSLDQDTLYSFGILQARINKEKFGNTNNYNSSFRLNKLIACFDFIMEKQTGKLKIQNGLFPAHANDSPLFLASCYNQYFSKTQNKIWLSQSLNILEKALPSYKPDHREYGECLFNIAVIKEKLMNMHNYKELDEVTHVFELAYEQCDKKTKTHRAIEIKLYQLQKMKNEHCEPVIRK